jgi:hypothetical protein
MAKRRRSWTGRFALIVIVLLAAIGVAPPLIARSGFVNSMARSALRDHLRGDLQIGSVSLGWLSHPVLRDVRLLDAEGRLIATIAEIEVARSLLSLAWEQHDLGQITVRGADLQIAFAGGISNLEQVLTPATTQPAPTAPGAVSGRGRPTLTLSCPDACITISDADSQRSWTYSPINFTADVPATGPIAVNINAAVRERVSQHLSADLSIGVEALSIDGTLTTNDLPLEPLAVIARRWDRTVQLQGRLTSQLRVRGSGTGHLSVDGELRAAELHLAGVMIGADELRLAQVDVPCRLAYVDGVLAVERLAVTTDLGNVELAGTFEPTGPWLDRPGLTAKADVDLAKLATLLPQTLSLHQEVTVTAGRLTADIRSEPGASGVAWMGEVRTSDLAGRHRGQAITWKQPLVADFRVRPGVDGWPIVDRLACDSEFLHLTAQGDAHRLSLEGNADLEALSRQLGQFVDLGSLRLAGRALARLTADHEIGGQSFRLTGETTLLGFATVGPAGPWREPNLNLRLQAVGRTGEAGALRLETAQATLQAGDDRAEATLTSPVPNLADFRGASLRLQGAGDLGRWRRRAMALVPGLETMQATGSGTLAADAVLQANLLTLTGVAIDVRDLRLRSPLLAVAEPVTQIRGRATYTLETGVLRLNESTLACATVAARCEELTATPQGQQLALAGRGSLQTDLTRLRASGSPAMISATPPLIGAVSGSWQVGGTAGAPFLAVDLEAKHLIVGPPQAPLWRDDTARLVGRVTVTGPDDLRIDEVTLSNPGLSAAGKGTLAKVSAGGTLNLAGTLGYDLQKVQPHLRPYLGDSLTMTGRGNKPFRLAGSLTDPLLTLSGETGLDWQSFTAFGAVGGPGRLHARLAQGVLQITSIEGTLSQGQLRLAPLVKLAPEPMVATLGKGGVERAKLTPAALGDALGYVAPLLANATRAEGELSVVIANGTIPLENPTKGDIGGQLILHQGRIEASPPIMELARLFQAAPVVSVPKDTVVPFRLLNGRVYHDGLPLEFSGVTLRSHGSVGLDGTLEIVIQMPIPPNWVGNNRLGRALERQTVRLVIGGTLSRPLIDERGLRDLVKSVVKDGATEALQQEIEKGLQKLLRPR